LKELLIVLKYDGSGAASRPERPGRTARMPVKSQPFVESLSAKALSPRTRSEELRLPTGAKFRSMSRSYDPTLEDRQSLASEAKRAMLAKFKQSLDPDSPAAIAKRRQREAIAAARAEREAQREAARQEHERHLARQAILEAEAKAASERAAAEEAARRAAELAEEDAKLKAAQKLARDARYAARKAARNKRRRGY